MLQNDRCVIEQPGENRDAIPLNCTVSQTEPEIEKPAKDKDHIEAADNISELHEMHVD